MPPERLRPVARAVEAAGLDELWVWEDCFTESGIASAALALGATERITVGIGLLPAPLRNVALTAMELATLERAIPGRLIGGVGHGVQSWMAQVGARVESPVTLLREYSRALRRLLDGEMVTVDGRYVHLDGVQLGWPPEARLPLMIGGGGPVTLRLAGELGDGTLLAGGLSIADVQQAAGLSRDGGRGDRPLVATVSRIAGDAETVASRLREFEAAGATTVSMLAGVDGEDDGGDADEYIAFLGREVRPLLAG